VLAVGVVLVSVGAQAADVTPQRVAKIAKKVYREMRQQEALIPADGPTIVDHATNAGHAATAGRASTAGHADTAGHATTAGRADTAARADTVEHATTADSATSAEVAEFAGSAESANPMAYAYVRANGSVDPARSFGITDADNVRGAKNTDCYLGPEPKTIQVTVEYAGSGGGPGAETVFAYAGLGDGYNLDLGCPPGTKFYVRGMIGGGGNPWTVAYFLTLVL